MIVKGIPGHDYKKKINDKKIQCNPNADVHIKHPFKGAEVTKR